jgi:hypothetical protein
MKINTTSTYEKREGTWRVATWDTVLEVLLETIHKYSRRIKRWEIIERRGYIMVVVAMASRLETQW